MNPKPSYPTMKKSQLFAILIGGIVLLSFTNSKKTGLKRAQKTLDGFCEYVPSGISLVEGDTLSVQSFYISSTEITNLQYQEFLFDLRRKGEADKYNIAKIDTAAWSNFSPNAFLEPMAKYYHSHPAYHNYPVVNVSKEGAELFCEWLTEKYDSLSNGELKLKFRLPYRSEWMRAASGDLMGATYSWGGPHLRNSKGQILANFVQLGSENISRNPETGKLEVISMAIAPYSPQDETADLIAPTSSYFPSDFGLYNMNGNVSEMIADGDFAVGGDWNSPGYDIRNESIKEFTEPNPTVGFRVVTTFLGREIERR